MKKLFPVFLFIVSIILFLYKLDYIAYFTDEILYFSAGREYILEKDYTLNLQHPLIAKYIAGLASLINEKSAFVLRLPFAILGAFFPLIVFKIIKDEYDEKWGMIGGALTLTYPFIFATSRMTMMEAPMHLFWLLFHLFFLRYLKSKSTKDSLLSGMFLGLAIATKFVSLILIPFSVAALFVYIFITKEKLTTFKKYLLLLVVSAFTVFMTYIDFMMKRGIADLIFIPRAIKDIIIERNADGKEHVVGGTVYLESPSWFYLYYIYQKYSPLQIILNSFGTISVLFNRSFFTIYWWLFFIITTVLMQLISLKNSRYISSIEIPLIFLSVIFIKYIYEWSTKFKSKKVFRIILSLSIFLIFIFQFYNLYKLQPTGEKALYDYMIQKTNNFTTTEELLIFSSIRSSKWQFRDVPEDKFVLLRGDSETRYETFQNFEYIAVSENEALKSENVLIRFLRFNKNYYDVIQLPNMDVYIKKPGVTVPLRK